MRTSWPAVINGDLLNKPSQRRVDDGVIDHTPGPSGGPTRARFGCNHNTPQPLVEGKVGTRGGIVVEVAADDERELSGGQESPDLRHDGQVTTAPLVGNVKVDRNKRNVTHRRDIDGTADGTMRRNAGVKPASWHQPQLRLGHDGDTSRWHSPETRRRGWLDEGGKAATPAPRDGGGDFVRQQAHLSQQENAGIRNSHPALASVPA